MYLKTADLLLNHVNRDYLLPSIQREFVWGRKDKRIEKLFDSIMQGYPIGSILVWELDKELDETKIQWEVYNFVRDYNEDDPHNEHANINGYNKLHLILDGQQRITALNIGLKGSYSYLQGNKTKKTKLYINLFSDIENEIDNTYGFKYEFEFFDKPPKNENQLWFEVGKVLDFHLKSGEDFKEEWEEFIYSSTQSKDLIKQAKNILGVLHKKFCDDDLINIMSVTNADDEKILNIFVRTNDGGMKLEKADLLLSFMESSSEYFKPKGARTEIIQFTDELNKEELNKPNFKIEMDDVLKACLVLSHLEVQYKIKNFNKKNLKAISDNWNYIKKYLEMTIRIIANYGFSPKNLISKNAIIPIAYYLQTKKKNNDFIESQNVSDVELKDQIIDWLIFSLLSGSFGSSSDSTLKDVRDSIDNGKSFKNLYFGKKIQRDDIEKWVDREKYRSKLSHLILMLITEKKYWDNCHQDHIYPKSKFTAKQYKKYKLSMKEQEFYTNYANSISNLHLLNSSINLKKSNDDFIDWQLAQNKKFLEGSLIPKNIDYSFENFKQFINKRKALIIKKLEKILM